MEANIIKNFEFLDVNLDNIYWTESNFDYSTPIFCFCFKGVPRIQIAENFEPKNAFVFEDLNDSTIDPLNPNKEFEFIIAEKVENIDEKWVRYILNLDMGDGERMLRFALEEMVTDYLENEVDLGEKYGEMIKEQNERIINLIEKIKKEENE